MGKKTPIHHVTDTAFWVATYRAEETKRRDALFQDPLASRLAGEVGERISNKMFGSKYVRWSVAIRTHVIDRYVEELLAQGVDAIINLGAGLDTRPYRMALPAKLKWIEVDYESTIRFKEEKLAGETPRCQLERIVCDLSDRESRTKLFSQIGARSGRALALTEGVIPYLSEQNVLELGEDLRAQGSFRYWIAEYMSPKTYVYFRARKRQRQMRNAPFLFMPEDWYGIFARAGWKPQATRYLGEESEKLGRNLPMPWWMAPLKLLMSGKKGEEAKKMFGFALFVPAS